MSNARRGAHCNRDEISEVDIPPPPVQMRLLSQSIFRFFCMGSPFRLRETITNYILHMHEVVPFFPRFCLSRNKENKVLQYVLQFVI